MATGLRSKGSLLPPFEPFAIYVHDRVTVFTGGRIRVHANAIGGGDAFVSDGTNDRRGELVRLVLSLHERYEQVDEGRFSRIRYPDERYELRKSKLITPRLAYALRSEGVVTSVVFQDWLSVPVAHDAEPLRLSVSVMQPLDIAAALRRVKDILYLSGDSRVYLFVRYTVFSFFTGSVGYLTIPARA